MPTSIPRASCLAGCREALERAISYTEAAEYLFSVSKKQEGYALSFLAMDECGKFILVSKAFHTSTADPLVVNGFADHKAKYGEVLQYCIRTAQSKTAKIMSELSKIPGSDLSDIAKLSYQALDNGTILAEATTLNTAPLRYRNNAFYLDFNGGWVSPRYPGDEVCAAQIKLVKGAAKSYLYFLSASSAIPEV